MAETTDNRQKEAQTVKIGILGAGSWGMTLASLYSAKENFSVSVYCRSVAKCEKLNTTRQMETPRALAISPQVVITSELGVVAACDYLIFACTSQGLRELCVALKSALPSGKKVLVSATKGLELGSDKRMSQIIEEVLPGYPVACLSGPNLASEVLSGLPTASVVASSDLKLAKSLQSVLSAPRFRVYANDDLIGVELGGTLKNVIAIAAGACDGLSLGINAKASLLTRGLAEMTRLAVKLGARQSTMSGLAGMGDLFATCGSPLSRNYRVGFELARGKSLAIILKELEEVAEGVPTACAVCELSKRLDLELPIAEQVESTLKGISTPAGAIMALLARPLASE
jgi:glycerol-3-phosphate dehydrogenase (NAD(P)+)